VGTCRDDADQLLVVTNDSRSAFRAALLYLQTGTVTAIAHNPQSPEDEMMLAHLVGWERVLETCTSTVKTGGTTIRYTDVYLKREARPRSISPTVEVFPVASHLFPQTASKWFSFAEPAENSSLCKVGSDRSNLL
jgi:hypothetical protein